MKHKKVTGVVLSGGKNSRYNGTIKSLLKIDGCTILEKNIALLQVYCENVILITNQPNKHSVYTDIPMYGDIYKEKGPLGGIHAALKNIESDAVLVVAGDMPNLHPQLVSRIISEYNNTNADLIISRINDKIEPLFSIYSSSVFSIIDSQLKHKSNNSIRSIFSLVETMYIDFSEQELNSFININTPEDYQKL